MNKTLKELAVEIHQNSVDKGFWENYSLLGYSNDLPIRVALLHSEDSELLEAVRKHIKVSEHVPELSGPEEECADIVIRLLDMCEGYQWNEVHDRFMINLGFNNVLWSDGFLKIGSIFTKGFKYDFAIGSVNNQAISVAHIHKLCTKILEFSNDQTRPLELLMYMFGICSIYPWNLEKAVELKMKYNNQRSYMHGNKAF